MFLNAGILRFAAAPVNITFPTAGDIYSAIEYSGGQKKMDIQNQIVVKNYRFDNRNGFLQGLNAAEPFKGKLFIEKKIYLDALSSADNFIELMAGEMEEPDFDEQWMNIKVAEGKNLDQRLINEYYQKTCNNLFGDTKCNYNGYANLASLTYTGTADSGGVDYLIDNALTQAADYWNFGEVTITKSGYVYQRKIADFDAATDKITFDVPLPVVVSNGDSYTVKKGCPRTLEACRGNFSYGPSANNEANFNGNIHLIFTKGLDK